MEEVQQIILWRQKIDDLWSSFGLDPLHGNSDERPRPDWRANARPHKAQNYIQDYSFPTKLIKLIK